MGMGPRGPGERTGGGGAGGCRVREKEDSRAGVGVGRCAQCAQYAPVQIDCFTGPFKFCTPLASVPLSPLCVPMAAQMNHALLQPLSSLAAILALLHTFRPSLIPAPPSCAALPMQA